jgi:putative membrane protein
MIRRVKGILLTVAPALAAAICLPTLAQTSKSSLSAADKKFVTAAAQGGMAEVKLGELATKNGSAEGVKQFGQKMVDDHSKANDELKQIASNKGVTLPADMDAKSKAIYTKLSKLHGAAFDAAYIKDMKMDHQHDIAEFSKEASGGHDADIKGFASKTLPVIKEHYSMISNMSKSKMTGKMSGKM